MGLFWELDGKDVLESNSGEPFGQDVVGTSGFHFPVYTRGIGFRTSGMYKHKENVNQKFLWSIQLSG